jgi:hypothetical protein
VVGGILYVLETSDRTTLRPATSPTGFLLQDNSTNQFGVDAISVTAGVVRACWALNAAETPTSLRVVDLTISSGMGSVGTTASGSLVFSAAAAVPSASVSVGPVQGGGAGSVSLPYIQPLLDQSGNKRIDRTWLAAFQRGFDLSTGPIDASRLTGVVPPSAGGTGSTTGLTVIDGRNIIPGTLTEHSWIPLVTGAEPPVFVTDGSGVLILVAGPSVNA